MKKFTVHSYLFDIIQSVERLVYNKVAENCENRWNHNPCVGGSSPSSATNIMVVSMTVESVGKQRFSAESVTVKSLQLCLFRGFAAFFQSRLKSRTRTVFAGSLGTAVITLYGCSTLPGRFSARYGVQADVRNFDRLRAADHNGLPAFPIRTS